MSDVLQCFILFVFNNFNFRYYPRPFSYTFKGRFSVFFFFFCFFFVFVFLFFKERIQDVSFVFISKIQNINSTIYFLAMMN